MVFIKKGSALDPWKTIRDKNLNNRRVSRLKKHDRKIKRQIEKIPYSINKGQRQTPFYNP